MKLIFDFFCTELFLFWKKSLKYLCLVNDSVMEKNISNKCKLLKQTLLRLWIVLNINLEIIQIIYAVYIW